MLGVNVDFFKEDDKENPVCLYVRWNVTNEEIAKVGTHIEILIQNLSVSGYSKSPPQSISKMINNQCSTVMFQGEKMLWILHLKCSSFLRLLNNSILRIIITPRIMEERMYPQIDVAFSVGTVLGLRMWKWCESLERSNLALSKSTCAFRSRSLAMITLRCKIDKESLMLGLFILRWVSA